MIVQEVVAGKIEYTTVVTRKLGRLPKACNLVTGASGKMEASPPVVIPAAEKPYQEAASDYYGFKSSKALKKSLKQLAVTTVFSNLDFDRPNPDHPITISTAPTHTAPQMLVEAGGLTVSHGKGYATARATHGFEAGSWYFEVEWLAVEGQQQQQQQHVRLGWAQILAESQAPVGYDEFGYGIRSKDGAVIHCGRHKEYAGRTFGPGDTLGVLIRLPEDPAAAMTDESLRDAMESAFPSKKLTSYKVRQEILAKDSGAQVRFTLNGQDLGVAFEPIYRGKYYPAVSCFGGAKVKFNFGPEFRFACPSDAKPSYLIYDKKPTEITTTAT